MRTNPSHGPRMGTFGSDQGRRVGSPTPTGPPGVARVEKDSTLAWIHVQGDLWASSLRAGWGASGRRHRGSVTNRSGPQFWAKGHSPGGTGGALGDLGGARVPGGQEQGRGCPAHPGPGSHLGLGCGPEALCPAAGPLCWAGLKIAGGRQGRGSRREARGEGLEGTGDGSPGPGPAVSGAGAPTLLPVAGQPGPADGLFFPCLTKYGQGAQPEGATWPAACLGCLAGYIRTAKVRPAPDTRGAPTPAPALGSARPSLPSPTFAQVRACTPGTVPFCSSLTSTLR